MMKTLLLVAAGAAVALTGAPASAKRYTNQVRCTKWHHGRCVAYKRLTVRQARRAAYRTGYRFGPSYHYTAYNALPRTYVSRYNLRPNYRYVYTNGYIYQVDPTTYAVQRVIDAITR
jgi:hypothetical protein